MLVVHLLYDTRDAMGANAINTAVEAIAPFVSELTGGRTNLRILSNLTDRRLATARCTIPARAMVEGEISGTAVARLIEEANAFAVVDPYRAATHNKGIMNGIDAVCIATGTAMMKMISITSITSTRGVVLMSDIGVSAPPPTAIAIACCPISLQA